jgi:hypothetical protein
MAGTNTTCYRPLGQANAPFNTATPVYRSGHDYRGYAPLCEQFEDIEVNGRTIRVSKGGLRRYYHNRAIDFIKGCDSCFKMVCDYQHLVIENGLYMLDLRDEEELRKFYYKYDDEESEISQGIIDCMSVDCSFFCVQPNDSGRHRYTSPQKHPNYRVS